jgi:putative NIF3 family GTP cyclohydrolase 1 type 2
MEKTIQDIIETILAAIPVAPYPDTVDVIKIGDPAQKVTGIAVTFLPTYAVIEQAIQRGANLIITHEPTFYNHLDATDWLENDGVYTAKRRLLEEHNVVVWRFHDYLHSLQPDPTTTGILQALDWTPYALPESQNICHLPPRSFSDLVAEIKTKLSLTTVRIVGEPEMQCSKIGILVGAPGGQWQIQMLGQPEIEVVICGEINEWETSEYVRDALRLGQRKALIVIGHAPSEEAGIQEIVPWLQTRVPDVPITFIPTGQPFRWI